MSQRPERRADLEALFERTRADPSGVAMQRMLARAREIPDQKRRIPKWWGAWATGLLVLSGLVATHAVRDAAQIPRQASSGLPASARPAGTSAMALAMEPRLGEGEPRVPFASAQEDDFGYAEPLEANVFDDLALDPGSLGEEDLEAWTLAASKNLGDG